MINLELPSGYDIRDFLTMNEAGETLIEPRSQVARLEALMKLLIPVPDKWVQGRTAEARAKGSTELELLKCEDWKTLVNAWRHAMKWHQALEDTLAVMLAVVVSTKMTDAQLWFLIVAPPSSGKSVLCEALSTCRKYCYPKSTITGFHSGYQSDKEGVEDNSVIPRLKNKTLITKDGDTLLKAPDLGRILSEARDLYDTVSRSSYRNKQSRDYEGIRMTWLLCGTDALSTIDDSELGARFLTCRMMDEIDEDLEDAINWRVINRVFENAGVEADGTPETMETPAMTKAKQLTGGFVKYLREHATQILGRVRTDEETRRECTRLAKFVSYMRAAPSQAEDCKPTREMSPRLTAQLGKLAICLAAVLGKLEVDRDVLRRLKKVALDTSRGRSLDTVRLLYPEGEEGLELTAVSSRLGKGIQETRKHLDFLRHIGAVRSYRPSSPRGIRGPVLYRLTEKLSDLVSELGVE